MFELGSFESDTLRDTIEAAWNLTGALSKTSTNIMKNPVKFFAHPQVKQIQVRKAVEVKKETPLSTDITHQRFTEINDVFTINCRYTVENVKSAKWDTAEARVYPSAIRRCRYRFCRRKLRLFSEDKQWVKSDRYSCHFSISKRSTLASYKCVGAFFTTTSPR